MNRGYQYFIISWPQLVPICFIYTIISRKISCLTLQVGATEIVDLCTSYCAKVGTFAVFKYVRTGIIIEITTILMYIIILLLLISLVKIAKGLKYPCRSVGPRPNLFFQHRSKRLIFYISAVGVLEIKGMRKDRNKTKEMKQRERPLIGSICII